MGRQCHRGYQCGPGDPQMIAAPASGLRSSSSLTRREPFLGGSLSAVLPRDGRRERLWNPLAAADWRTSWRLAARLGSASTTWNRELHRDCTGRAKGTLADARSRDRRSRLRSVWRGLASGVDHPRSRPSIAQRRLRIPEVSARTVSRSDPRAEPPRTDPRRVRCDALREPAATPRVEGVQR